jgi:hypothetical protein
MSILHNISPKIIASLVGVSALGGLAVSAANTTQLSDQVAKVQSALISKDLNAWKTASIDLATAKINSTTQEQLNTKSERYASRTAVNDAIEKGDYESFKKSADQRMLSRIASKEDFDKLVSYKKVMQEHLVKVADAVKKNDFDAFKNLAKNKPTPTPKGDKNPTKQRPTPSDEQLKTRFDAMVAAYKADGTLPTDHNDMRNIEGFEGKGKHMRGNTEQDSQNNRDEVK